jgi:hypothetical protein
MNINIQSNVERELYSLNDLSPGDVFSFFDFAGIKTYGIQIRSDRPCWLYLTAQDKTIEGNTYAICYPCGGWEKEKVLTKCDTELNIKDL